MKSRRSFSFALAAARGLVSLALVFWMGGLLFFGMVTAPVVFRLSRAAGHATLGPQMVAAMLHRFSFVTMACAGLLVVGWWWEGRILRPNTKHRRLWRGQGVLSGASLLLAVFLGFVLLPKIEAEQALILPLLARVEKNQILTPAELQKRADFEAGHRTYQNLAKFNLALLLGVFVFSHWRAVLQSASNVKDGIDP